MPERFVARADVRLRVLDEGDGPPVLLLHGFPDRADMWDAVGERLRAAGRRTVAPDLRGFGGSSIPPGGARRPYRIDHVVADLVAVLDELALPQVELVGHDWGAIAGWALALAHPDRVSRFTALSVGHPVAYRRAGLEQKRKGLYTLLWQAPVLPERLMAAQGLRRVRAKLDGQHPDVEQVVADLARPGRLTAGLGLYRGNALKATLGRWGRCTVPVTGVWSSGDAYLAEDQMTGSARLCDAPFRYVRLDGAGHWLPLERPGDVAAIVLGEQGLRPSRPWEG